MDCAALSDDELVTVFESLTLASGSFRHADHVRLAFVYLRRLGLLETLRRYGEGLRRLAAHHGVPERYHETVTWAFVVLVHERLAASDAAVAWSDFAAGNPDLLRWRDGAFFDYYDEDVLDSELARRAFVLPRTASDGRRRAEPTARLP